VNFFQHLLSAAWLLDYCGLRHSKRVTEMYHNLGNGRFKNVTPSWGSTPNRDQASHPDRRLRRGRISGFPGCQRRSGQHALDQRDRKERPGIPRRGLTHGSPTQLTAKRVRHGHRQRRSVWRWREAVIVTNLPTNPSPSSSASRMGFHRCHRGIRHVHVSLPYTGFGVGLFDMANRGMLDFFSANGGVRGMAPT